MKRNEGNANEYDDFRAKLNDDILNDAELLGHVPIYVGKNISDAYTCSCGWEGKIFCNDNAKAYYEWLKHVFDIMEELNWTSSSLRHP